MRHLRSVDSHQHGSAGLSYGILSALDPDQRKAAEILTGQVLLKGGPGSGKTRTLTHRLGHLVTSKAARADQCLVLVLDARACREMNGSLKKMLGKNALRVQVKTFQSFGMMILEEQSSKLALPRGFRLTDQNERKSFAVKALQWSEEKIDEAMLQLARAKGQGEAVQPKSDAASLQILFDEWRDHEGWLDDEDLLSLPLRLFTRFPEAAALYRDRFRFISVDEYQEVGRLGYQMLRHLVHADGNLCVSGDSDQAITRGSGDGPISLHQFEKDFPFTHHVQLTRNYRSGSSILKAASQVIAPICCSRDYSMTSLREERGRVEVCLVGTDRAEAEYVTHSIEKFINGTFPEGEDGRMRFDGSGGKAAFSDIAVFYRNEEQADLFKEAFTRSEIPFQCYSSHEVDSEAADAAKKGRPGKSAEPFAAQNVCRGAVSLLKFTETKGLEFPIVYMTGCEEGLIPGEPEEQAVLEEEQRLFYTVMTRAQSCLFLIAASKRLLGGQMLDQKSSRFLKLIKQRGSVLRKKPPQVSQEKMSDEAQLDLF